VAIVAVRTLIEIIRKYIDRKSTKKMPDSRQIYDLEGTVEGRRLWLLAPGPSAERYDEYRDEIERKDFVIAVNSALEFSTPDLWFWADKRFGWIYGHEIAGGSPERIGPRAMVCPSHQVKMIERFRGTDLWFYDYQMKLRPWEKLVGPGLVPGKPFWYSPTRQYLPGRASAVNNAISLAWLLRPRICILVGVDWTENEDGRYYRSGIKKNRGPTDRNRALNAGLHWFRGAMEKQLWDGLNLTTISDGVVTEGVKSLSWEDAFRA
jgi:hypothetical protein